MFRLGLDYSVFAANERVYVQLSGLEESFEEGMNVFSPVSWAGVPLELDLYKTAKKLGLICLEDAACSLGAKIGNDFVGKIADFSCFSFSSSS